MAPVNSFILYCQENRTKFRDQYPDLSNSDISKLMGDHWRAMEKTEKDSYKTRAAALRKEFREVNPSYTRKPKYPVLRPYTFSFKVNSTEQSKVSPIKKQQPKQRTSSFQIEPKYRMIQKTDSPFRGHSFSGFPTNEELNEMSYLTNLLLPETNSLYSTPYDFNYNNNYYYN